MTEHKITEFYTQQLNACTNKTSKFQTTIAIFKSSIKEHSDSNKTCKICPCPFNAQNFICLSAMVHESSP
jgi:demethoxyubiquinone hydroxylase (CLK1/Coq7/Cat5 family)